MERDDLKREWEELAPKWIEMSRVGPNPMREGLLDAPMLSACGDVRGKAVIECGCGEGRFCRMLLERGAGPVLGLDLCRPLIEAALEMRSAGDDYRVADVQDMGFLEAGTFDLAVSYLNQCDLPDMDANNREVFRVLRPGGRFVVANVHPMRSACGGWVWSDDGERLHAKLDRYLDEGERRWDMKGVMVTNFHRTLSTCVRSYLGAGFILRDIVEPSVTDEALGVYPDLDDEKRVPNFIIFILEKA